MSALILLLERAIEWVVVVRYSCSRHLATACGMRCQMPLVGGMGEQLTMGMLVQTGGHAGSTQATPGQKGDSEISRGIAGW